MARHRLRVSDQPQPLQAGMALAADDDVVVHRDAEGLCHLGDLLRHLMSAADGEGSPEGWLWTRMSALAESSRARFTTSRGYTGVWSTVPDCCTSSAIRALRLSRNSRRNCSFSAKAMAVRQ